MKNQRNMGQLDTLGYIDGNTVRALPASPQRRREETHREYQERRRREQQQRERQKKIKAAVRKNQERALQMSPGYVLFLACAMVVMTCVLGCYLKLQAEFTGRMKKIAVLEKECLELQMDNDASEIALNTSMNLDEVKKVAESAGMEYPKKDQIIYYQADTYDYMVQYEDVPAE